MRSRILLLVLPMSGGLLAAGCSGPGMQASMEQRQDQALKDPMNYSPDMQNTDIMGAGIGSYDDKHMKQDLNDVFNP
jgi:hypothetical protein